MTVSAVSGQSTVATESKKSGFGALDQADFIRLITTELQMQDPSDPVDNKEMIAQMTQFSSLAGIADVNKTLQEISAKLDAVTAQASAASTATSAA